MNANPNTLPDGAPDQIDLNEQRGLDFWCEHFGCTVQQLQEAVKAAGPEPSSVRSHFLDQGSSGGV